MRVLVSLLYYKPSVNSTNQRRRNCRHVRCELRPNPVKPGCRFPTPPPPPPPPTPQDLDCDDCVPRRPGWGCALGTAVLAVLLFAFSWDVLEPTEWGLVQNGLTGYVDLDPAHVSSAHGGAFGVPPAPHHRRVPTSVCHIRCTRAAGTSSGCVTPLSSSRATWSTWSSPISVRDRESWEHCAPSLG